MPDKIRLLPDTVASQIAAGEVVNRPASVVKEMMENSVDAGATAITVSYRNGGKELIKVIDDGEGMSPLDARMAFDKHATSKITRIEDVYALHTFGFRGEALASIAAIAHVELTTRRPEDELGTQLVVEGSRFQSQENVVAPVGSQFAVKNLFFNVPARRRALDKSTTEPRHIAEEFRRVAMCHPEMSFSLYGEDAPVYTLHPSGLKQRIVGLVGKHAAGNLLEVGTETSLVKITGFVGKPSSSKQTNREQYMYVNGRFFKSPYFHKAVMQAYEKLIPAGTQPSYFLFFEVDAQQDRCEYPPPEDRSTVRRRARDMADNTRIGAGIARQNGSRFVHGFRRWGKRGDSRQERGPDRADTPRGDQSFVQPFPERRDGAAFAGGAVGFYRRVRYFGRYRSGRCRGAFRQLRAGVYRGGTGRRRAAVRRLGGRLPWRTRAGRRLCGHLLFRRAGAGRPSASEGGYSV